MVAGAYPDNENAKTPNWTASSQWDTDTKTYWHRPPNLMVGKGLCRCLKYQKAWVPTFGGMTG
jgi:hypothetical protein